MCAGTEFILQSHKNINTWEERVLTLGLTECVLPVTGVLGHYGPEKATLDTEAVPPTGQVSGDLVSLPAPRPLDAPSQEKPPVPACLFSTMKAGRARRTVSVALHQSITKAICKNQNCSAEQRGAARPGPLTGETGAAGDAGLHRGAARPHGQRAVSTATSLGNARTLGFYTSSESAGN